MADTDSDIAIEEYRQLWSYYQRTLDERRNLFEWYFKAVTLPAAVVGSIAAALAQGVSLGGLTAIPEHVLPSLFTVIFLTGLVLLVTYAKESANAHSYGEVLNEIRDFLKGQYPSLGKVLVIHERRKAAADGSLVPWTITAWRGGTIMVVNAAIGVTAASTAFNIRSWGWWLLVYVAFLVLHSATYSVITRRRKPSQSKRRDALHLALATLTVAGAIYFAAKFAAPPR
jgi:hypothetical protein